MFFRYVGEGMEEGEFAEAREDLVPMLEKKTFFFLLSISPRQIKLPSQFLIDCTVQGPVL